VLQIQDTHVVKLAKVNQRMWLFPRIFWTHRWSRELSDGRKVMQFIFTGRECYNYVTTSTGADRTCQQTPFEQMIVKLTKAERDTILAALRRWQSFPAAREADLIATNGGKHRPLDNSEIERICKRLTGIERKRGVASRPHQSDNGADERKVSKTPG
jgi:hypothetical protein